MAVKKAKKASATGKVIGGALIAGVLGLAAGMLLAPKAGKKLRGDLKDGYADFYKFASARFKQLKNLDQEDYQEFIDKTVKAYAKAKKLSVKEVNDLMSHGKEMWNALKKHF